MKRSRRPTRRPRNWEDKISALVLFVQILIGILWLAILLRIIFSWIAIDQDNPLYKIVHEITEPILAPIRQLVPRFGMFDLSPMIASFLLYILLRVLWSV